MIRLATIKDIKDIMRIINQAKAYFKASGINQWQDGYPNEVSIVNDISLKCSYVLEEDGQIIGTMYFTIGDEPTYHIIEGEWLTSTPYSVIHRIAIDNDAKGKNYARQFLNFAIEQSKLNNINSIRIDTHEDNKSMQRFLLKNGFTPCGIIHLINGDPRIGFELLVK